MTRVLVLALCAQALAGCTAFDLWDAPDVVVEARACRVDTDCDNVDFEVAEHLRNDPCLVAVRLCDTQREACTVDIRARDSDQDNFRDTGCKDVQTQFAPFGVDCDDANADAYPGADKDGDGYVVVGCSVDGAPEDCDDERATAYPGATVEACDGVESRCTSTEAPARRVVEDFDDDRFSPATLDASVCSDVMDDDGNLISYSRTDCDDADRFVYPNAPDVCDGRHNDCNNPIGVGRDIGEDVDGDGFASPTSLSCDPDIEGGPVNTDCDDVDPKSYPGARESCDGIINDCTARPQVDFSRDIEDPDGDGRYAGNADCIDPYVNIECISSAFDRFAMFCPPSSEAAILANASGVRYLRTGDYDHDGRSELVYLRDGAMASCATGDQIVLRYSDLAAQTQLCLTVASAVDSAIVDADGDGPLEVVTLFSSGIFLVHDIQPTLVAKPAMGITVANGAFAVGRLSDVATPVIVVVEGGALWYRPLDASAVAGAPIVIDPSASTVTGIVLADLDGDGRNDILTYSSSGTELRLYPGAASGTFGAPATIDAGALLPGIGNVRKVRLGDVEGSADGDVDLVVLGTNALGVLARRNNAYEGVPVGVAPSGQVLGVGAIAANDLTVRDLGSDGAAEIVYTEMSRDTVGYIDEIGSNLFAQHVFVSDFEDATGVAVGDFDGDGDEDVAAHSAGLALVSRFISRFVTNQAYSSRTVDRAFSVGSVASADFNVDGLIDFVGAESATGGDVIVWRSRTSDFGSSEELLVTRADAGENVTGVGAGDVTDDALSDIVLVSEDQDRVSLIRGVGDGSFSPREHLATFDAARAVRIADLDRDGAAEIIVISRDGLEGRVAVYARPEGQTTFARTIIANGSAACTELGLGDVDADDDLDVAVSCGLDGLFVLVNPGSVAGTWVERVLDDGSGGTRNTTSVALLDMDRDGDADVVSFRADVSDLLIHAASSTGLAAPTSHDVANVGASGARIAGADIDRDGDFDIIVAPMDTGASLRILQTMGGARSRFVAGSAVLTTGAMSRISALGVADLNRDGDDDFLVSIDGDRDVVVYRSSTSPWWAN